MPTKVVQIKAELKKSLEDCYTLLNESGEYLWTLKVERIILMLNKHTHYRHVPEIIASWFFYTVGSLDNLVLSSINGHTVTDYKKANGKLYRLRTKIESLAEEYAKLISTVPRIVQSKHRYEGPFKEIVFGTYGDFETKYLWTIDRRGVSIALEKTPFDNDRGYITHTSIGSPSLAAGEAWFGPNETVSITASLGRFGYESGQGFLEIWNWGFVTRYWENLGYKVHAVAFKKKTTTPTKVVQIKAEPKKSNRGFATRYWEKLSLSYKVHAAAFKKKITTPTKVMQIKAELKKSLEDCYTLLNENGEAIWKLKVERIILMLNKHTHYRHVPEIIASWFFGTFGSFDDLRLSNINGHTVTNYKEANSKLYELGAKIESLAEEYEKLISTVPRIVQSRQEYEGPFKDIVFGTYGDFETKYLWTIDRRGVNIALEKTPFDNDRGYITHTSIGSPAYAAGEAWFGPNETVSITASLGRFGYESGQELLEMWNWGFVTRYWGKPGYKVHAIAFKKR